MLYPGQTHDYQGRQVTCTAEIDGKFFYVIVAECLKCKQRHVLVDMDFHGWNGYICHDPKQAALPRPPLKAWNCTACSEDAFSVQVTINSEGMIDFVEETDGEFPAERWPDGFGYIDIAIVCIHCRHQPESWAGCETM